MLSCFQVCTFISTNTFCHFTRVMSSSFKNLRERCTNLKWMPIVCEKVVISFCKLTDFFLNQQKLHIIRVNFSLEINQGSKLSLLFYTSIYPQSLQLKREFTSPSKQKPYKLLGVTWPHWVIRRFFHVPTILNRREV